MTNKQPEALRLATELEHFADAHNAAVRHLRALATQSVKQEI